MSLDTLINIVNEKIDMNYEELIIFIELIQNEEDFTKRFLLSNSVSENNAQEIIGILKNLNLLNVKYLYECKSESRDVAITLDEKCIFCNADITNGELHTIEELYNLKGSLMKELKERRSIEFEKVIDPMFHDHFKELKLKIEDIVPFIGSGISIPLGLPSWTGLISKMVTSLTDEDSREQFEEYIKAGDIFSAIEVLQHYSLSYSTDEQIKDFIHKYIKANFKNELDDNYHNVRDILNLESDFFVTTNYDNALNQYKDKFSFPFILDDLKDLQEVLAEKNQRIIHLHGNVEKKETMIVTEKDYKTIYDDEKNKSVLSGLMSSKSFLFIGFSFTDKYFVDMYEFLRSHIGGRHYIILADLKMHKAKKLMANGLIPIGIKVESYQEKVEFSNVINDEYTQRYVNSLKKTLRYLIE